MPHAIQTLRSISEQCASGTTLGPEELRWLGEALNRFLSRQSPSLDHAVGLPPMRGGVPWWMEEAIRIRDAALRELAVMLSPDGSACARARIVHTACVRYAAGTWRFDRDRDEMPPDYAGSPRALLWQAFQSKAAMPLGERHLRSILS